MKEFKVQKVLTHNIILGCYKNTEYILIGKGIGFKKKPDEVIYEKQVSSHYIIQDVTKLSAYERIVLNTPVTVLLTTEKAIALAEEKLASAFDESIHLSLLDHINFALYRLKHQLKVEGFFSDEYSLIYPDLYEVAVEMVNIINQDLGIELPTSEIGAIILHLHAALNQEKVSKSAIHVQVIDYSLHFIEEKMGAQFFENQLAKARLITHLKFALKRLDNNQRVTNQLVEMIKEKYPEVYAVAEELAKELKMRYGIVFFEPEISYIALHVYNLQN